MAAQRKAEQLLAKAREAVHRAVTVAVGASWRHLHRAEAVLASAAGVVRPLVARSTRKRRRRVAKVAKETLKE